MFYNHLEFNHNVRLEWMKHIGKIRNVPIAEDETLLEEQITIADPPVAYGLVPPLYVYFVND